MSKPRKKVSQARAVSLPRRRLQAVLEFDDQLTRVASILISQGGAYLSTPPELAATINVRQLAGQYRLQFAKLQKLAQAVVDLDAEAAEGRD